MRDGRTTDTGKIYPVDRPRPPVPTDDQLTTETTKGHILYDRTSACVDPEVKRSKVKVTRLLKLSRGSTVVSEVCCCCCCCVRGAARRMTARVSRRSFYDPFMDVPITHLISSDLISTHLTPLNRTVRREATQFAE